MSLFFGGSRRCFFQGKFFDFGVQKAQFPIQIADRAFIFHDDSQFFIVRHDFRMKPFRLLIRLQNTLTFRNEFLDQRFPLLDEFRGGKLGNITLELPEDIVEAAEKTAEDKEAKRQRDLERKRAFKKRNNKK